MATIGSQMQARQANALKSLAAKNGFFEVWMDDRKQPFQPGTKPDEQRN